MAKTKTAFVAKNLLIGSGTQVIFLILSFINRTIFIYFLGKEYLGLDALFTNILMVLSFAELGIGNAIIFSLYKSMVDKNKARIKAIMALYAKAYRIIGLTVFIVGLLIMPFLNLFIKNPPNIPENIYIIYFLFLLNTAISYMFSYKKAIFSADQKEYIINVSQQIFFFIQSAVQLTYLYITRDYIGFVLIQVIGTFGLNVFLAIYANKKYTYLKGKTTEKLEKTEVKTIFQNVKALAMYKFGSIIMNGTDSIIIAAFLGLSVVGIYSNYLLIIAAVVTVLSRALNSITGSIGHLNNADDDKKKEQVFKQLFFIVAWIYFLLSIILFNIINPFITLWIGESFVLGTGTVLAIVASFYINGMQFPGYTYRTTMGLFRQGRYVPIAMAVLNIILSIIFAIYFGLTGVIVATIISRLVTTTIIDPYLVYRFGFKKKVGSYFKMYLSYATVTAIAFVASIPVMNWIYQGTWLTLILGAATLFITLNITYFAIFYRKAECQAIIRRIKSIMKRPKTSITPE
ncbi:lipopolysaccharide biosynthesis protein [Paenilisteria rocourtiae]|uniref:O-antigen/teichoic acid export membrane protein n=1 Tax=Listeria rocourtiae TaxID=647910 RepID=A0A4R6ZM80_9LIST|nr:oligosaccharide flippase family protein [Listeria rocourtiae]EUJ47614.1 polysaccharide biosynthesis protein [Listeria rocourtiae FSL F6-920]MBC1604744.1 oligosaccharide flippase family protein [Listeria rocourtiae]TDR53169.1 O-antigen/teichoic acid export membrane protein [Listeria rocourtiae]